MSPLEAYCRADVELTFRLWEELDALDKFFETYYYHGNGD